MAELKLSGNHLKGSRPVLSFDKVCLFMAPPAGHHFIADIASGTCCHTCSAPCGQGTRLTCDSRDALLQTFDEAPHWQLLKEVFSHVFATPKRHHRSKPFFDHVIAFCIADGRVWLRNYQVSVAPGEHWMSVTF